MPYTIVNQFLSVAASAHGAELQSIIGSNGTPTADPVFLFLTVKGRGINTTNVSA